MGYRTFQYRRRTILMHPLQELLTSCRSQQNGLILSLASPPKRRRTRSGSGIVRSVGRASARVRAAGRFVRTLVRIVVRLRSAKEGTVSDRIRHVPMRGRKPANSVPYARLFSSRLHRVPTRILFFLVIPCMYAFSPPLGLLSFSFSSSKKCSL